MKFFSLKKLFFNLLCAAAWLLAGRAAAQMPAATVRAKLLEAEQSLERGQFLEALRQSRAAQAALPQPWTVPDTLVAEIYLWLGKCHSALAEAERANTCLDSASILAGETRAALFYSIENQISARKGDVARAQAAAHYFEGKNALKHAESLLAIGTIELGKKNADPLPPLRQSLELLHALGQSQSILAARCQALMGYRFWKIENQYEVALAHFRAAESIFLQKGGPRSNHLAALYVNLGGCLDDLGYPRKAIEHYKIAEQNFLGQNPQHPNLLNVYNNLGNSYGDLGEYSLSIRYLEQALTLAPPPLKGRYWNGLGDAFLGIENWPKAEQCFQKALELLPHTDKPSDQFRLARPHHNLAIVYRQRGELTRALASELRSIPLRKADPTAFLDIARSYHGAGECYRALHQPAQALAYLDSALWLQRRAIPAGLHPEIADAYLSKSKIFEAQKDFLRAMSLIDSAFYACGYARGGNFGAAIAPVKLLAALAQCGQLYHQQYLATRDKSLLAAAELAFDTAAQAIRFFRNSLLESESRATLAGQFREILSSGVEVSLAAHRLQPGGGEHLQRAFAHAEQSKALVLLEGVRSAGEVKFEGVPDSIIERERALQRAVSDAEITLRRLLNRNPAPPDSVVAAAKNRLFEEQRAFVAFQQMLASGAFVEYHNFRFGFSMVTPTEVQSQLLAPGGTLVSYFIGKENRVTAFVIQKTDFQAIECGSGSDLETLASALREGLFGYHTLPPSRRDDAIYERSVRQYVAAAQELYRRLVAPIEPFLGEEVSIVPDGVLGYVPFELLLAGAPADLSNFGQYPYWFKQKNRRVGYTYSATLLREMTQKKHRHAPARPLLAMAPFFPGERADVESGKALSALSTALLPGVGGHSKLKPLPHSGPEVGDICKVWNGNFWVGKAASKSVFLREAPDCQILHLSTHGVLDSSADFSFLVFPPAPGEVEADPLFVRDLYNLRLNADLVTLSACETGVGKIQRGEGIISLARAFAYAGAKSIVTSLWQVDNAATKDLMRAFYQHLRAGKSKSAALHAAKLDYLQTHPGEAAHPFFWAGLVGVGDMQAIGKQ
jgi:CHAT domain-containing protein/Tfp pilus assembly protein PilF